MLMRAIFVATLLLSSAARATDAAPALPPESREPCAVRDPLRLPFFGDTHVHTAFSQDASTQGTRNTPRDAYRFAKGEVLGIQPYDAEGRALRQLQLTRPLDFTIVTDHAEQFGEVTICQTPGLEGYDSWVCNMYRRWPRAAFFVMNTKISYFAKPSRFAFCGPDGARCREAALTPWREIQDAAEGAYDRSAACRFTTFVGYEWTGATGSKNLHRNVIFRNAAVPRYPTSYVEEPTAEGLWASLRRDCLDAGTGCDVLTIPHNSNLSGGLMFEDVNRAGQPLSREDAATRAFFEPLVEIMQHKGSSECNLDPGNVDELCDFELLPYADFQGKYVAWLAGPPPRASFVRDALKRGLLHEERVGVNPFKYGIVASTDSHLAAAGAVEEEHYPGHGGAGTPAAAALPKGLPDDLAFNPGGLAVLWAEENTREALFQAMRRREAYGTSGTRPVLRFFGGWDYPQDLCGDPGFVATGYARGVPMGSDLPPPSDKDPSAAPRFAVLALADPGTLARPGTPLQRLQIVKGWIAGGATHERVYEVAGDPQNGADVDHDSCERRGAGFSNLCAVWRDPAFDPSQRAFYYVRAVENPSCRWSGLLCSSAGVRCTDPGSIPPGLEPCCSPDHHWTVQERAWSSPIWYAPTAAGKPTS
jgi:hypothetical protein